MPFILFCIILYVLGVTVWIVYFGRVSKALSNETKNDTYIHDASTHKILMVGDSVMRGVGTSDSSHSLGGLVATFLPSASITVCAQDGARSGEILRSLQEKNYGNHDQAIIFYGGMDIIFFSSEDTIKKSLCDLFAYTTSLAPHVIYVSPPDVGSAPIFPFPVSVLYTYRSKKFISLAKVCAKECGVVIVDYSTMKNTHFARDKSHPNDVGYKELFELFKEDIIR